MASRPAHILQILSRYAPGSMEQEAAVRNVARGLLHDMPTPETLHPFPPEPSAPGVNSTSPREVILSAAPGHEGIWVPAFRYWDLRDSKTALEIAVGAATMLARSTDPAPMFDDMINVIHKIQKFGVRRSLTLDHWNFLIGLCVVGHAERITLDRN